jgi:hypothetical protein
MKNLPDINASYREDSFDKDVGYCASDITIRQSGARVDIRTIYTENEIEKHRADASGTISRVYEREGMAQIKLDDGRRTYFDLNAGKLRDNVEFIGGWFETESFDARDKNQMARLIQDISHIARAIEPAFAVNFQEQGDICWGEYDYPFAAYGSAQRKCEAIVGDADSFHCRMTMTQDVDDDSTYRFARLLLEARGLPAEASVSFIINSYGHSSLSVRSPLETHPSILDTLKTRMSHIHIRG